MPANDERSGFRRWLDRRTGLDSLLDHALDEPIPGGAKIAYVFGSGLLFLFLSQIVTGVFLAMYYVPSAAHAHTTVAYITVPISVPPRSSFFSAFPTHGTSLRMLVPTVVAKYAFWSQGKRYPVNAMPSMSASSTHPASHTNSRWPL